MKPTKAKIKKEIKRLRTLVDGNKQVSLEELIAEQIAYGVEVAFRMAIDNSPNRNAQLDARILKGTILDKIGKIITDL